MKDEQAGGRFETLLSRLESNPPRNRGGDKYESRVSNSGRATLAPFTTSLVLQHSTGVSENRSKKYEHATI